MKGSLNLGKVAGIKVEIHWTFIFLIAWIVFVEVRKGSDVTGIIWAIVFVLMVFLCVVLHELGHALTARQFDIQTKKISLLPIGGVASLEKMPEDPKQELLVAVAGPAVNVVIAILLFPLVTKSLSSLSEGNVDQLITIGPGNFLLYLFITNIFLVLFNAIPAFPMDGGRVLRALLSMRMDRVKATEIAATLGQAMAFLFFFLGLFSNPFLIIIAIFIYFGAGGEYVMVQHLAALRGFTVGDAMMTNFTTFSSNATLREVGSAILAGTERNFIVVDEGVVQGVIFHKEIIKALQEKKSNVPVRLIMHTDIQRFNQNEKLTEVYSKAQANRNAFFPVMDNSNLIGTIDMENINEFMLIQAALDY